MSFWAFPKLFFVCLASVATTTSRNTNVSHTTTSSVTPVFTESNLINQTHESDVSVTFETGSIPSTDTETELAEMSTLHPIPNATSSNPAESLTSSTNNVLTPDIQDLADLRKFTKPLLSTLDVENSTKNNTDERKSTNPVTNTTLAFNTIAAKSSKEITSQVINVKEISSTTALNHLDTDETYINSADFFKDTKTMVSFSQSTSTRDSTLNSTTKLSFVYEPRNEEMVETDAPCSNPNEDALLLKVLVGGYDGIYWADQTTYRLPTLVRKKNLNAYSVDYHYKKGYMFFLAFHQQIMRMNINQLYPAGKVTKLVKVECDVQLCVDWVQDQLYWMSNEQKNIVRANLDGEIIKVIYLNESGDYGYPRNLVIDPYAGYLFFVGSESAFKIDLRNDSIEEVKFSMADPGIITCLAIQRHERRVYFSGTNEDTYVASSEYDGSNVQIHHITADTPWHFIFSIDVYRDDLIFAHYSEEGEDALYEARISSTNDARARKIFIPPKTKQDIGGIRIYHSNVQSPVDIRTCLEADNE